MLFSLPSPRTARRVAFAAGLTLLASACFFAPGKFDSQLDLNRDHSFSFRYTGEIIMIPLQKEEADAAKPFEPSDCFDDDTFEERSCTDDEIAQQKTEWQAEKSKSAKFGQALLGGIDPSDPKSGEELAAKLRRRQGWNRVEYLGGGTFDVDYAVKGQLDHDFVFPTFEGFPMANAFVQITPRKDGSVRVNAPTFGPESASSPASGLMPGMPLPSEAKGGPTEMADGTFSIRTDGTILANNTDEGPAVGSSELKVLTWDVNPRIPAAPTALIQLAPN